MAKARRYRDEYSLIEKRDDGTIVRKDPKTGKIMPKETSRTPPAKPPEKARSIRTMVRPYTPEALQALVDISRNSTNDNTRLKAIELMLAYGWGKPYQQKPVNEQGQDNPFKDMPTGQLKELAMKFSTGEEFEAEKVEDGEIVDV